MRRKQYSTFDELRWRALADEIAGRYGWSDTVYDTAYGVEPSPSILGGFSWRVCPNTKDTFGDYWTNLTREIAERQRAEEIHKALGSLAEIREADANDMDEDNDGKTLDWLFEQTVPCNSGKRNSDVT